MKSRILIVITSDPRTSARPAEAVRIAAGVAVLEKVAVTVYLRGEAVRVVAESRDALMDEDNFTRYLPLLADKGRGIYTQEGAGNGWSGGEPIVATEEISDDALASLAARQNAVLHF
jgi:hypothetical protein